MRERGGREDGHRRQTTTQGNAREGRADVRYRLHEVVVSHLDAVEQLERDVVFLHVHDSDRALTDARHLW